jgi:hypothetical protein
MTKVVCLLREWSKREYGQGAVLGANLVLRKVLWLAVVRVVDRVVREFSRWSVWSVSSLGG